MGNKAMAKMLDKTPSTVEALLASGKREHQGRTTSAKRCRLSRRVTRGQPLLVVTLTNQAASDAGILIGQEVRVFIDASTIVLIPSDSGTRVRRQGDEKPYPYLLIPIGDDCLLADVQAEGTIPCDHQVDDGCLVLKVPDSVILTLNDATKNL